MAESTMGEAFLTFLDELGPLKEAVNGYREDWLRRGYSPRAAEAMAMDLHRELLRTVFASVAGRRG